MYIEKRSDEHYQYMRERRDTFLGFLKKIKDFGYSIYVSDKFKYDDDNRYNYAYIVSKDGNKFISTDQFSYFGGYCVSFSSVHKPNKFCGQGFVLSEPLPITEITKELIEKYMDILVPSTWKEKIPIKYKDFKEFREDRSSILEELDLKDYE